MRWRGCLIDLGRGSSELEIESAGALRGGCYEVGMRRGNAVYLKKSTWQGPSRRSSGPVGIVPGLLSGLAGASVPVNPVPAPEPNALRTMPFYPSTIGSAGGGAGRVYHQQRIGLDAQAAYLSSYMARGRQDGNGQRMDPVLEAHLRVGTEEKK
ncbi:MAG: hypothetical protein ABL962_10990 [Fimbriimonadaceae bacterium]